MQSVWSSNRLALFSTLGFLLLFSRPALADDDIGTQIRNCTFSGVTCDVTNTLVQKIDLMHKKLTVPFPDLSSLTSLEELHLDYNQFSSYTKGYLSNLTSLKTFTIDNTPIGDWGVYTDVMKDSKSLTRFSANSAGLSGPIPDIGSFGSSLEDIHLSFNKITGTLPAALAGSSITTLWLNNNGGMTGNITVIGSMSSVQQAWLHGNQFSGSIPDLSKCTQLADLLLSGNRLVGTIPPTIGNLTNLQNLTLRSNALTGPVLLDLTKLTSLSLVDVSSNNLLSGTITVLPNVNVVVSDSKVNVRKSSTPPSPGSVNRPPPGSPAGSSGTSSRTIAVIVVVVIIVAAAVGFCFYKKSKKKKRLESYKRPSQLSDSEVYTTNSTGVFRGSSQKLSSQVSVDIRDGSIQMDLLIQVTDNFSEEKIIGRGGFGTVYKGKLPADGREVAVKRMVAPVFMSSKGMAEYKAEIEVLSEVKHRNLVGLIGFCANGNERILVYEFMPQGTLGDHLFEWRQRGGRPLTWSQRAAIALDVARGVDYLHTMTEQSFIHRDLKPNNILLGDDMRAKVADFGLVKNAGNAAESIQTKVAGTFGYFAPEYWETGRVTTKVDVYAFGVILMEIISGRKVVDDSEDAIDGGNLMLRFKKIIAGIEDVRGHIDPTLHADEDEETYREICKVVELAGHCTVNEPQRRCDMRHAVYVLTSLVEQWTPSNSDVSTTFGNGMPSASYTYTYT